MAMNRMLRTSLHILVIVVLYAAPALVYAQTGGFTSLADQTGNSFSQILKTDSTQDGQIGDFVQSGFRAAIAVGAILAVMRIAWAGYQYMTSDAWGQKSHAKEVLGDVIIGLLLLLSIYLILRQINPEILSLRALQVQPQ